MTDRNERETNRDSDPLELMDWLESNTDHGFVNVKWEPFMKLRTAIEAQLRRFNAENAALRDELAQKDARIARLEQVLKTVLIGGISVQLSDGAWIEKLTKEGVQEIVRKALNEHPRQSAAALTRDSAERSEAALKAEALREAAEKNILRDEVDGAAYQATPINPYDLLDEADRIEREAKERVNEL